MLAPFFATLLLLAASRPGPGDPAPDFALAKTGGGIASLRDFQGRTLVLAFFPKAFTAG